MSRSNGKSPRFDWRLNLSRARGGPSTSGHDGMNNNNNSPHRSSTSSSSGGTASPPSSCVSSDEAEQQQSDSPDASMIVVGCPRCMMYVMLSEHDQKCPKCKSTVLVDFHRGNDRSKKN
ncbi:hypothetical protein LUZ61_011336 [Rhynchospora tenuis]|uniref:GIR1-like zinc ribbon domain-containing protein n=1 Tax=Rhynchospora tenuis TaxID=198213 RepID=A0AAD6A0T9_9POAL|nr:hypothetical protein LUZ61_011336 [Rhynchospora tenuis]